MKTLSILLLLASPSLAAPQSSAAGDSADAPAVVQAPTPLPGSLDSSKIRLDAHDSAGALADAETALAHGGGAEAYAARADAKRALGRPVDEAIADYAEAAKLDPRYIEKYQGLIAQKESEAHPGSQRKTGGKGLNGVPIPLIVGVGLAGGALVISAVMMLRKRETNVEAPDDEAVKAGGKEKGAGEEAKLADGEQPPKKEPPKP
jgi:tetratricopeptide (TPR) repeat protein